MLKNRHGIHARTSAPRAGTESGDSDSRFAVRDSRFAGNSHTSRGCHTRANSASAAIDARPPAMSTSSTPTKLLQAYCTAANVPPQTSTAGHTPRSPRQPLIVTTSHAGTMSDTNGSWRPAMTPRVCEGIPVTAASVRIGVPMAPNATGAVFAMSDRPAA